ncbi:transporter substrate-binding domain-containing protein [Mesorhizobium sp. NZP2298]|uniref:transporter substrate-binding domain-containing protein n=1 Tax=Mesorhizobium sp. NZP2298 TaxID=2483403 RepID=UPI0015540F05|nr:transporter substrate-binding domain-containing protein [Mesorhizobium sp. NZP2298]QKC99993.1 amino acid ABC transporter substrate-binding protein [Mesorhizobium sp. NZP2298]
MNKLITTIAATASLAVASAALPATANAGAVLDKVLQTKTLTAAVGTDWGKMAFLNDKHELDGYDIEVVKSIAKGLGVQAKFVTPSWDVVAAGKWEGRWDMTTWMTPTKARAEKFDFPAVYINDEVLGAVHKDSKVTKLSELEGKVVGVASGTAAEQYVNHKLAPDWIGANPVEYPFKPGEVKTYASSNVAFDDLRLGDGVRLDAVLGDGSLVQDAIKAGYPLKEVGVAFDTPAAIAILPGDKQLSDKIAAIVQGMKEDGSLSKLSIKWFGVDRSAK